MNTPLFQKYKITFIKLKMKIITHNMKLVGSPARFNSSASIPIENIICIEMIDKIREELMTEKPLTTLFLVFGRMMRRKMIAETIINVIVIGLNKVKTPFVTNDSYVNIFTPWKICLIVGNINLIL